MVWFLQLTSSRGPVGGWGIQSNIHATNLCQPTESADVWSHLAGSGMVHHDQVNRGLCEEGLDIQFPLGWGDWIAEFISAVLVANFFSCETGWSQGIRRWEVYGVMRSSLNDLKDNATQTTVFCCCLCRATVNCGVYFRGFGGKVLVGGHKGITPPPKYDLDLTFGSVAGNVHGRGLILRGVIFGFSLGWPWLKKNISFFRSPKTLKVFLHRFALHSNPYEFIYHIFLHFKKPENQKSLKFHHFRVRHCGLGNSSRKFSCPWHFTLLGGGLVFLGVLLFDFCLIRPREILFFGESYFGGLWGGITLFGTEVQSSATPQGCII